MATGTAPRSSHPLLRTQKREFFERRVRSYVSMLPACIEFAPSDAVRQRLRDLEREVVDALGAPTTAQQAFSEHVLRRAAAAFAARADGDPPLIYDEFRRYTYPDRPGAAAGRNPTP